MVCLNFSRLYNNLNIDLFIKWHRVTVLKICSIPILIGIQVYVLLGFRIKLHNNISSTAQYTTHTMIKLVVR